MPLRPRPRSVLMILAVLLIVGCGGPNEPGGGGGGRAITARSALGDLRTVDPCTLTDQRALARLGEASTAGTVSLDYCLLHVRTEDGSLVQLSAGELGTKAAKPNDDPVVTKGSLRIAREAPLPGHCSRRIVFADDLTMRISADLLAGDPSSGLCGIAETGAESAITAIRQDRVGHWTFPSNSLALTDPCAVLDSGLVHQIPGLQRASPQPSPAKHQCRWGRQAADSPRVELTHTAGDPPKVLHGAAVEESIAGRRTVVSMVGGNPRVPLCSAETEHLPFGPPGSGQREVAMLVVALPGATGIEACEFARGFAERAWPRLPRAGNG